MMNEKTTNANNGHGKKSEENARMTQIQWPKTMAKQKASESDGHKMHLNGKYKNRANGRCLSRRSGERE